MHLTQGSTAAALFRQACTDFDFKDKHKRRALITTLETTAQVLAQCELFRHQAGEDLKLWTDLRKLWRDLSRTQLSFWDIDDSSDEEDEEKVEDEDENDTLRAVCTSLAKFTRNLVAGVPTNQFRAYDNEPDLRRLLHFYTSWSAMEDRESIATARVLTQALSNTVTANDPLVARLWDSYMNLPEDQVVLIRLLGSPDPRTLLTTLIFILNCVHGSRNRTQLLTSNSVGVRVCIKLLDNMVCLHEAEEGSDASKAFDVGYAIFAQIIEEGMVPDLYRKFSVPEEIVTPHQTTLLKLVDSYLQSTQQDPMNTRVAEILGTHESLGSFLAKRFFSLSSYSRRSIARALETQPATTEWNASCEPTARSSSDSNSSDQSGSGPSSSSSTNFPLLSPAELDAKLPKVCEALVLVTQCIITISLEAEEQQMRLQEGLSSVINFTNMKNYFNKKKSSDQGIVESLIDLLRQFDLFLPRINFGKPVNPDGSPSLQRSQNADGFSYLKRDLVRLLGVLCYGVRAVQDRTRAAGGLPVVMNLCVIDERNPYLREHAIFTLRNLLQNNRENQQFVDSLKPSQEWDDDGTLKTIVGAILK